MVWFIYKDCLIIQEEGNNEFSVNIFRLSSVESSLKFQAVLVVHPLEVILLGWLGDQSVDISKRVFFITEAVVRRDLTISFISIRLRVDGANGEIDAVFL